MAQIDDGNVECQTLECCWDTLYRGFLNTPSMSNNFHKNNLISYDVLSTYSGKFEDNEAHAKNLVEALVCRVKDDRSAFPEILEVIKLEKSLAYLAKILEDKKNELEKCSKTAHQTKKRLSRATASPASPQASGTKKVLPKAPVSMASASKSASKAAPKLCRTLPEVLAKAKAEKSAKPASSDDDSSCEHPTHKPVQQVASSEEGPAMLHGSKPVKTDDDFSAGYDQNKAEEYQSPGKCKDSSSNDPLKLLNLQHATICQSCQSRSNKMAEQLELREKQKEALIEEYNRKMKELRDELRETKEDKRELKKQYDEDMKQGKEEIRKLKSDHYHEMQDKKTEIKQLKVEHADEIKSLKEENTRLKREMAEIIKVQAGGFHLDIDSSAIRSTIASLKDTIESCEATSSQSKDITDDKILDGDDAEEK